MNKKTVLVILFAITIFFILGLSSSSPTPMTKHCIVKLYAGSNVVQTWESLDFGQVDGETLIFTVGSDVSPQRVRIHGTWSIEEKE